MLLEWRKIHTSAYPELSHTKMTYKTGNLTILPLFLQISDLLHTFSMNWIIYWRMKNRVNPLQLLFSFWNTEISSVPLDIPMYLIFILTLFDSWFMKTLIFPQCFAYSINIDVPLRILNSVIFLFPYFYLILSCISVTKNQIVEHFTMGY